MSKRKTTAEFIEEAKKVHGDKYDYSKVKYVNRNTKVCIICPEHGEFWQSPSSHLNGCGCSKCFYQKVALSTSNFIEQAKKVHGNKYDYSNVEYIKSYIDVHIICPKHGEFIQLPSRHLQGDGCPICGKLAKMEKNNIRYNNIMEERKLSQAQKEILCGTLLGDSSLQYMSKNSKTPIFTCNHGPQQKEYAETLAEQLNGQLKTRLRYDKRTDKVYTAHTITTLGNSEYITMFNQLYINGKKCITKEFLQNFTERSLAYLYMDDGYTIHNTMFICTDAFDEESCDNLIDYCEKKI